MEMKMKGNEDEVKMKMRWKLLSQDAKRGTQKKREGENTNTGHLAQRGQNLFGVFLKLRNLQLGL